MADNKKEKELEIQEKATDSGSSNVSIIDTVWNFLSSMKLGIILLLAMAIISIVGTIWVPKDQFGRENFVGFYNSWFFRSLMGLLALNLLICSLNRWKAVVNTLKGPKADISLNFIRNLKSQESIKLKTNPLQAAESVKSLLKKRGYRIFDTQEGDSFKVSSDRGHLGILGPYLTHLSFIVLIVAIVIKFSGVVGWEGTMAGLVGETVNVSQTSDVQGKMDPQDNFDIKINDFRTEYRPDGSVKQWLSEVTVIDGNKTFPYTIYVNNPLIYKGIKFYQSSYGYQFSGVSSGPGAANQQFAIGTEQYIQPAGTDITFIPVQYNEATKKITVQTYKGQQGVNQEDITVNTPYKYEQAEVTFQEVTPYTVFTVKKDPGVPIVGAGSLLLMVGMIISFILRQRRIWAVVTPDKDGAVIQIGGQSAKDKRGMENDIEQIVSELKA